MYGRLKSHFQISMELKFWTSFEFCQWLMNSGARFGRWKGGKDHPSVTGQAPKYAPMLSNVYRGQTPGPLSVLRGHGASVVAAAVAAVARSWTLDGRYSGSLLVSLLPSLPTHASLFPTKSLCSTYLQGFLFPVLQMGNVPGNGAYAERIELRSEGKWRLRIRSLSELWIKPHLNHTHPRPVH